MDNIQQILDAIYKGLQVFMWANYEQTKQRFEPWQPLFYRISML